MPVAAERDDVRMLDEQKLIRNLAALALLDELALQLERFGVADASASRAPRIYALIASP